MPTAQNQSFRRSFLGYSSAVHARRVAILLSENNSQNSKNSGGAGGGKQTPTAKFFQNNHLDGGQCQRKSETDSGHNIESERDGRGRKWWIESDRAIACGDQGVVEHADDFEGDAEQLAVCAMHHFFAIKIERADQWLRLFFLLVNMVGKPKAENTKNRNQAVCVCFKHGYSIANKNDMGHYPTLFFKSTIF